MSGVTNSEAQAALRDIRGLLTEVRQLVLVGSGIPSTSLLTITEDRLRIVKEYVDTLGH